MPTKLLPTPLSVLRISKHQIPAFNHIPNTSIQQKPVLLYHSAFPATAQTTASAIEHYVSSMGVVSPQWRYTMYSTTHFHSTTHEVLCISKGRAKCCFGGEGNPDRLEVELGKGDVVILPAGVGHRLLEDLEGGFEMVGCYPKGMAWDMCYGREGEDKKVEGIKMLGWFDRDPLYGERGPALEL